jgi:hypothetical protein
VEAPSPLTDERRQLGSDSQFAVRGSHATQGMDSIHALLVFARRDTREGLAAAIQSELLLERGVMRRIGCEQPSRHFRALPTSVNTVLTFVPTVWTAVMIKTAISDAMRAYSIAVAPESLSTKIFIDLNTELLLFQTPTSGQLGFLLPASPQRIHPRFR